MAAAVSETGKMKIEILGTGCQKCRQLEANAKKAVEEKNVKAEIVKVTDIARIIEYGVMSTPAIVIDGEVKCYGRLADIKEIKKWL
jgi:small redox-active disulfide protein 2